MRILPCAMCLIVLSVLPRAASCADDFKLEAGFTPLFNGKDLTGWKMRKGGESLDGKPDAANKRITAKDGLLIFDPKVKGDIWIDTAKQLKGDVYIKFEYMPGKGCNNDLFLRGVKFDIKDGDVKNIKYDEWNEFEIVVVGKKIEFKNNGEVQKTGSVKSDSGPLGVRAEFGPIQYRRLRVKEEAK
jgi:Domain of Unknown Function (DUF1080)